MKHAPQLHEEMKLCQRRYSLSFWQNMTIMNRPLNSVIHNNRTNVDGLKSTNDIKVCLWLTCYVTVTVLPPMSFHRG